MTEDKKIPFLPLRDIVIFPYTLVPLYVGREKSIRSILNSIKNNNKELFFVAQKNAQNNAPSKEDIHKIGTIGEIIEHIKRPDGTFKISVKGKKCMRIKDFISLDTDFLCCIEPFHTKEESQPELNILLDVVKQNFENYTKITQKLSTNTFNKIIHIKNIDHLVYAMAMHLPFKQKDKQLLLEMDSISEKLQKLQQIIHSRVEILGVEKKIRDRVKTQMKRSEKEYYLNEQMRAIKKELGEKNDAKQEVEKLQEQLKAKKIPEDIKERIDKEIQKLKMMSSMSAEATVIRNHVEWCLSLPWFEYSEDNKYLDQAEAILNEDHYGLEKPKERIIEYLAVHSLIEKLSGPILCFIGPPGVGKTSLARSISRATGRTFVRQSLGGVRDEAEIKGHRRTYIGALPGKIIQSLKRAKTSNPVLLLDEIDKMSFNVHGNPASALLEVLDPEQNSTFNDHYLDLDYDISKVMFICTANTLENIPRPLLDRLEIIRITAYTEEEKIVIAKKYLIPKQVQKNGIDSIELKFSEDMVRNIIQNYTREAGVRNLERQIASICRKIAKKIVIKKIQPKTQIKINLNTIKKYLGMAKFLSDKRENSSLVGMATGLAWTQNGGDILEIEVTTMPGKGKLNITGKLGDVMQESAQAAMSYVRSRAMSWGLPADFYQSIDIHIHVPDGATPKDGPSAGITMTTALISALTKIPVRNDIAMTGEITLRGRVLQIGGIKEKALGAYRAGIKKIIIPKTNKKDIQEIPKTISKNMQIYTVEHLDEVLRYALELDNTDVFFTKSEVSNHVSHTEEKEIKEIKHSI